MLTKSSCIHYSSKLNIIVYRMTYTPDHPWFNTAARRRRSGSSGVSLSSKTPWRFTPNRGSNNRRIWDFTPRNGGKCKCCFDWIAWPRRWQCHWQQYCKYFIDSWSGCPDCTFLDTSDCRPKRRACHDCCDVNIFWTWNDRSHRCFARYCYAFVYRWLYRLHFQGR